nr:hypothetical protein [uncultured Flavobacterium sp.]
MTKFRKKPVVIEAEQWLGTVEQKERLLAEGVIMEIPSQDGSCLIPTLEGNMTCMLTDYIIKGVKGEYYPCKAEIFELTYDLVEEEGMTYAEAEKLLLEGKLIALPEWGGFWFKDEKTNEVLVLTKEGEVTKTPWEVCKESNDWIVVEATIEQQKIVADYFASIIVPVVKDKVKAAK